MLDAKSVSPEQLLPNTNVWMEQLSVVLKDAPNARVPLSLTSSLGGAYSLVKMDGTREAHRLGRDRVGRSIPARMALYTTELLTSGFDLSSLPQKLQTELLYLLCLVVELAEDELLTSEEVGKGDSTLWFRHGQRNRAAGGHTRGDMLVTTDYAEVEELISSARKLVNDTVSSTDNWADGKIVGGSLVGDLTSVMLEQTKGLGSLALYSAKALGIVLQMLTEAHGLPSSTEDTLAQLEILKAKPDTVFSALAFITGFGQSLASSKAVKVFCNRLISDVAGAKANAENTLLTMVLLNACLSVYESGKLPVENRRQIFAVRQIASWTENPSELSSGLASEVCKALTRLFPNVETVYGPYWEDALKFCISLWNSNGNLCTEPCIHASLKLSATLESMAGANDDLDDALAAHAEAKSFALLHLLKRRGNSGGPSSDIVDALLCRRVAKIPLQHIKDLSELYEVVASESRELQTAAFGVLSKGIAAAQSQLSIDVLLEKRGKEFAF